jgi:hypothetical protein
VRVITTKRKKNYGLLHLIYKLKARPYGGALLIAGLVKMVLRFSRPVFLLKLIYNLHRSIRNNDRISGKGYWCGR